MPDDRGRLFADEVAARVGIQPSDWRARVSRGHAPEPAERVLHGGSVRSVWDPTTIDEYLKGRAERLAGQSLGDHPHTDPGDGRKECGRCGKFVWEVTHSCKGVPVTEAAMARFNARLGEGG